MRQRIRLGPDVEQWWLDEPEEDYALELTWRGNVRLPVGVLRAKPPMFRYKPDFSRLGPGAEKLRGELTSSRGRARLSWLIAKAFARAGWARPGLDPAAWLRLLTLRRGNRRCEFILDTNALVHGIGHWLVAIFGDCCDLVVTPVTLREVQDAYSAAQLTTTLDKILPKDRGKALNSRQVYLAASRFREFPGARRPVWRELAVDDTALLLSRGLHSGEKSSEADTLMLRAVRRHVTDKVNGLDRFFVTSDVALARRAATELPADSVIAANTRAIAERQVLAPCHWWPGPDQGWSVFATHGGRLCWELLCFADVVELTPASGRGKTALSAFDSEMWPSDYTAPWVQIETEGSPKAFQGASHPGSAAAPLPATGELRLFTDCAPPDIPAIDANLRFNADIVVDIVARVSRGRTNQRVAIPEQLMGSSSETFGYLQRLFEGLRIVKLEANRRTAAELENGERLRKAARSCELDQLAALFRPYRPFAEAAGFEPRMQDGRPDRTTQGARRLAAIFGQIGEIDGEVYPGTGNPTIGEVRDAIKSQFERTGSVFLVYDLFVEVFLKRLRVGPGRAAFAWDRMLEGGVFDGIEFRTGGTSPRVRTVPLLMGSNEGLKVDNFDLDSFRNYRDLVKRSNV